jgi:hypothetical protein
MQASQPGLRPLDTSSAFNQTSANMYNVNTQVAVASSEAEVSTVRDLDLGISMISEPTVRLPFCAATRLPFCSLKLNASTAKIVLTV